MTVAGAKSASCSTSGAFLRWQRRAPCPFVAYVPRKSHGCQREVLVNSGGDGFFGGLGKMFQKTPESSQAAPVKPQAPPPAEEQSIFPPYTVVRKGNVYDLRLYDVYSIVEMEYQGRAEAYAALGEYFDGENEAGTRFKYTQPVVMQYQQEGTKYMQMYVGPRRGGGGGGSDGSATSLPRANKPSVRVSVAGGELVAVMKFEGYITPETAAAARTKLLAALAEDGLTLADGEAAGLFRVAQYGPIFSLMPRLNEIMLRIKV